MSLFGSDSSDTPALLVFHDEQLQVLQYELEGEVYKLVSYNELELTPGIVQDGNITDIEAFKASLSDLFSAAQPKSIKTKKIFVNIPHHLLFTFVNDFSHHVKEESMRNAMMDEVKKHSPILPEDLSFDYDMKRHHDEITYSAYAIPVKWQEKLQKALESIGINSIEFVPEPVAQMSLMTDLPPDDFLLYSCHHGRVSASIFHNGLLYDSYRLGNGSGGFAEDCSRCFEEYEKAKSEVTAHFKTELNTVYFVGFDADQRETAEKEFTSIKEDATFIGGFDSPLNDLLPYNHSRSILFGLFNYAISR